MRRAGVLALVLVACAGEGDGASLSSGVEREAAAEVASSLERVRVVDVREVGAFEAAHVPGATRIDEGSLRATVDGVEGQVVPRAEAVAVFSAAGLGVEDFVVVTGEDNGTAPARVAWTLRYYGHRGPIALLDGGMAAWTAFGGPVESGAAAAPASEYGGGSTRGELRVDEAWMLAHLDDPEVAIFDVRTPDEYEAGHIPGAILVPWTDNLAADGAFVPAAAVRENHGDPEAATLVVYCRTGSRASVSWALLRDAGYEDVRLYDGSWTEWGADPATPKEP
ncbi:MAG: rhodanese-like domain-containing protein [Nannocystaceae bacterium]